MKSIFCFLLVIAGFFSRAQSSAAPPCSSPKALQFDFWIGEWNLYWNDSLKGTNLIEKILGQCTVHENFRNPETGFSGQSWSVYNPQSNQWQQTWVDNQGGYIVLNGGMQGDSMVLTTAERKVPITVSKTGKSTSRMVFYHIKPDSFDWTWEASGDGISWTSNWKIHYVRKK